MDQFTDIFIATSLFFFPTLCLMGSLLNINTELFYFIAATKLPLIKSERKKNESYGLFTLFLQEKPIIKVLGFKILYRENAFLSWTENTSGALFACIFLSLLSSSPLALDGAHQMGPTLGISHTWIKSYCCLFCAVWLEGVSLPLWTSVVKPLLHSVEWYLLDGAVRQVVWQWTTICKSLHQSGSCTVDPLTSQILW